ncbi:MAG: H-X9-DG-CTERM domain-containing protein [Victivallales bacterium]|jgi:prepilin-type processing-associated H-X9-DG protein
MEDEKDKSRNFKAGRCSRFTLIEMLLVISIIALLLILLLPVLAIAKEKARGAACRNNLKQIGTAIAYYPDENNGYAIPCLFEVLIGGENKFYSWFDYLYNNSAIVSETAKCPSMCDEECFDPYGGNDIFQKHVKVGSYTMNVINNGSWGGADIGSVPSRTAGWGFGSTNPVNLKKVSDLSDKICIADVLRRKPGFTFTSMDATMIVHYLETDHGMLPIETGVERRDVGDHHSGGFNALFGDGHVDSMRTSQPKQWTVIVE